MINLLRASGLLPLFLTSQVAQAKLFSSSYLSFELPPEWTCTQEGTEWVCVSRLSKESKEALILLTAKEMGPSDSLANYMNHLKQPRLLPVRGKPPQPSQVLQVSQINIGNHPWVDALHLGSETPSYYTRYLATVRDRIAILVTFSAFKTSYTRYSQDFIRAINSLRVTASKDLLSPKPSEPLSGSGEQIGTSIPGPLSPGVGQQPFPPESPSLYRGTSLRQTMGLALILIGCALFALWWFWTKRKSKRQKKRR